MELMEFKNQIWNLLRGITEDMETFFQPVTQKYGLTMMQIHVLLVLKSHGVQSIGSLGRMTGIAGGNMSAMCKKLQQLGFVQRIRDRQDERIVQVILSEQGENTITEIDDILLTQYSNCMKRVKQEDLETIIDGMKKLRILLQGLSKNNR